MAEIKGILDQSGYPTAYREFKQPQKPPFICYMVAYSNNFSADGVAYAKTNHIQIELYTKNKDLAAEGKLEQALSSFYWHKHENYIDSEGVYQIIYEIEV